MTANSDANPREAAQAPGGSENSPPEKERRNTLVTEASVNVGAPLSPAMLLQMKALIEGAIDGAVDKKLHALGMNLKGSDAQHDTPEGGGSKSTPSAYKQKHKDASVVQGLVTRLPLMTTAQEEGFLTDWESPYDEDPKELREATDDAWAKKCAQQKELMKLLAKELEKLKKQKQIPERASEEAEAYEGEIHILDEVKDMIHPISQRNRGHKVEFSHAYIDESIPFSADIQTDPIPGNFKTISCEYQGKGDPEEHLMKFESLCLLHQYSEGVKCRVFLTTLSGTAQHWLKQLPRSRI